jgi:hypothetical protein
MFQSNHRQGGSGLLYVAKEAVDKLQGKFAMGQQLEMELYFGIGTRSNQ